MDLAQGCHRKRKSKQKQKKAARRTECTTFLYIRVGTGGVTHSNREEYVRSITSKAG